MNIRTGIGYDVHRLVANRPLILGGVKIPFDRGLEGHSDADVVLHAICDALLGAAALGDIGQHFPAGDPAFLNADSLDLLRQVRSMLQGAGFEPINIDVSIICEEPRIGPHAPAMRLAIAEATQLDRKAINIKATTNEGMGFVGRGEGIAAFAIATIHAPQDPSQVRALLQRVTRASVSVGGDVVGQIGPGFLVLVGVTNGDSEKETTQLASKVANLRVFDDEAGNLNRSALDLLAEDPTSVGLLVVSQFTLYADARKGRRPSFVQAAPPAIASPLVDHFAAQFRQFGFHVEQGVFGAEMQIALVNDGPVTIWLDTADL